MDQNKLTTLASPQSQAPTSPHQASTHQGTRQGSAGWILLASLGVSFVISGDFAGWQFGLKLGGFGGLAVALGIVAALYLGMCLCLAELSAAIPSAGGGHLFATVALGRTGGFITAAAIMIEYVIAPAAITTFIGGYVESLQLFGLTNGWPVYLASYVIFVLIHLAGAGEALKLMLGITGAALVALVIYSFTMAPHVSTANFADGLPLFPHGAGSVWHAIPFAIWFFLAVEGVPMAAEDAKNPSRDIPKAIVTAMTILFIAACAMMILGPGAAGTSIYANSDNPLVSGLKSIGASPSIVYAINCAALTGLVASFFSIMYGYSRLVYSMSRERLIPPIFSRTNRKNVPTWATIAPAILSFGLTLIFDGDFLMSIAVFGAVISYALMMLSHIVLRRNRPKMTRPYRTPGGLVTSTFAFVLALGAIVAQVVANPYVAGISAATLTVLVVAHLLHERRKAHFTTDIGASLPHLHQDEKPSTY